MCWMAAGWVITNSAHVTRHTTHNENPKCIGNLQAAKQAKLFCWFTKDKHNWITERAHGHGYETDTFAYTYTYPGKDLGLRCGYVTCSLVWFRVCLCALKQCALNCQLFAVAPWSHLYVFIDPVWVVQTGKQHLPPTNRELINPSKALPPCNTN